MSRTLYVTRFTMMEDLDPHTPFSAMANGVEVECDTKGAALDVARQLQCLLQEVRNPMMEQPGREWLKEKGFPPGFVVSYDGVHQISLERIA